MKVPKNWNPKRPFVAIAISLWRHSNFFNFYIFGARYWKTTHGY